MKRKTHFRIIVITAMVTVGTFAFTAGKLYKKHYKHKMNHCEKVQKNSSDEKTYQIN